MSDTNNPFGSLAGQPQKPADRVYQRLTAFIGPNVARMSVRTFAQKAVGVAAEDVRPNEAPKLVAALRPLLRSMLGEEPAERIVKQLSAEFTS